MEVSCSLFVAQFTGGKFSIFQTRLVVESSIPIHSSCFVKTTFQFLSRVPKIEIVMVLAFPARFVKRQD